MKDERKIGTILANITLAVIDACIIALIIALTTKMILWLF
jgi:hypothetical protein